MMSWVLRSGQRPCRFSSLMVISSGSASNPMFQTTRRRLALWYTAVTAVLLVSFASGVYLYVRNTLVERVDDTLNHVVEVVQRSLVIVESAPATGRVLTSRGVEGQPALRVDVGNSFQDSGPALEDDHIDIEWFDASGELQWSTLSVPTGQPLQLNSDGKTVHLLNDQVLRQISRRVQVGNQVLGYLRVSHPWFEVSKPSRQLVADLSLWSGLGIVATGAIGWLLSGLAMAPVRQSYQQLKQFTADASHELRNPIAVIQTNVQVALADPDIEFQQDQLRVVERLTRRLGRLVDNLLFLARQDSGLIPMQWESFNLEQLLAEVVEEQRLVAEQQGLKLDYRQVAGGDWHLSGDRDQLLRLFTNLVSNGIQYTPTGSVSVAVEPFEEGLQVQVTDTGIGIDPAMQERVFDRFYRADPARGRQGSGGTGLGLAIAKAIVDNHRGRIAVSSKPDQGTTVTVTLPRQQP